jgi:PTS system sorbose-specific IIA component
MVKVIFCAHGHLAAAMLDSVEMVFGKTDAITALSFERGENAENIIEKMTAVMAPDNAQAWLVAVDLMGGSPYNAAANLALRDENIQVVTGLSLPLALEIADNQSSMTAAELADHLVDVGRQCVLSFRRITNNDQKEEEDFL